MYIKNKSKPQSVKVLSWIFQNEMQAHKQERRWPKNPNFPMPNCCSKVCKGQFSPLS